MSRRAALRLAAAAAVTAFAPRLAADEVAVPIPLQMALLGKVAGYDKNLGARAGDRVHVLLVTKPGNIESSRAAAQADHALSDQESIGGLPHDRAIVSFADAPSLARLCRSRRAAIVYLTPGFGDGEVDAIASALAGGDLLSATAVASQVTHRMVLGFDLVSGKPKLLVNLAQARRQHVDLSAEVLKLMKVVE